MTGAPTLEATAADIEALLLSQGRPMASCLQPMHSEIAAAIGRPATTVNRILTGQTDYPHLHRFGALFGAVYIAPARRSLRRSGRAIRGKDVTIGWWWVEGVPCPTVMEPPDVAPWAPPGYAVHHREAAVLLDVGQAIAERVRRAGHPLAATDLGDVNDWYTLGQRFGRPRPATAAAARYDSPARRYVTAFRLRNIDTFWLPETPIPADWPGGPRHVAMHRRAEEYRILAETDPRMPRRLL